eukprot:COSAG02_NODE_5156_length_4583_cov_2.229706_6_plen_38_part_01
MAAAELSVGAAARGAVSAGFFRMNALIGPRGGLSSLEE